MKNSSILDDSRLKEQIECLRGRPIDILNYEEDHYIEESTPELLCKAPLVSVHMLTYNHELFISKAIESVMMQQCDFDFELIIGEDCSSDQTLNICLNYQKRYPSRIRVLHANENSFSKHQSQLLNFHRVTKACRGTYIAWLEGDDYWLDPQKLAKEVAIMSSYPEVGLVYTGCNLDFSGRLEHCTPMHSRLIPSKICWEKMQKRANMGLYTPTMMWRKSIWFSKLKELKLYKWALILADIPLELIIFSQMDAFYLADVTAAYRINPSSLSSTWGERCHIETLCITIYMSAIMEGISPSKHPLVARLWRTRLQEAHKLGKNKYIELLHCKLLGKYSYNILNWCIYYPLLYCGNRGSGILRAGYIGWFFSRQWKKRMMKIFKKLMP